MEKITVFGDIMVEPPFLQQVKTGEGYDFVPSFAPLKGILEDSDYVIANLETPLAGEEAGYTSRIVSFNAPDCLLDGLKEIGVDAVSTANNHCLDRGYEGLTRTLDALDRYGIAHTGTYRAGETGDRIHYFTVGQNRFALISYTFSTNAAINGYILEDETRDCVNLLHPQVGGKPIFPSQPASYLDTRAFVEGLLGRSFIWEETVKLKIAMHLPVPSIDDLVDEEEQDAWFRYVERDYLEAKKYADIVLFCPHCGGQFNEKPGRYTQRLVEKCVQLGIDGVFAAHSHTSQRAVMKDGIPCFYSMGNVSMSSDTFYSVPECLPEYGLAAHLYVEGQKIRKVTFSVFKMVEENGMPMRIMPVDILYRELSGEKQDQLAADVAEVCGRVLGKTLEPSAPCREYDLV